MGAAAADQRSERRIDLRVSGMRIAIEELDGGHEPAVDAVRALIHLFFDPRLLDRVGFFRGADTGKRRDFLAFHRSNGRDTGTHRVSVNMNRAGATLTEPAAETRIDQAEFVAKSVEKRHRGVVDLDRSRSTVDLEGELLRHGAFSFSAESSSSLPGTH